jgi:hypothetical protein
VLTIDNTLQHSFTENTVWFGINAATIPSRCAQGPGGQVRPWDRDAPSRFCRWATDGRTTKVAPERLPPCLGLGYVGIGIGYKT